MNRTEFEHLVKKFLEGAISPEEEQLLSAYYDSLQQSDISWDEHKMGLKEEVKTELYRRALNEIAAYEGLPEKKSILLRLFNWRVAAALLPLIAIALFFFMKEPARQITKNNKPAIEDVVPGRNRAVLTLADGSEVDLDDSGDGVIGTQGNVIIDKSKDGQLIYRFKANNDKDMQGKLTYNTIRTPQGGQYQLVLSDDSRVWLNAGSSIEFPTVFSGAERRVTVRGEAYFEVAKDKKRPFRVSTDQQLIEVLGTHFNVNAYSDEDEVKTTLLEGAVKIVYGGNLSRVIKPGQQARLSGSKGIMDVVKVDTEEAVSWKNGYFLFDNEDIHSVMRKISRWYNVEVVFLNDQLNERFGGSVSKFENVSQVLKILEVTGTVHFKIEGRRITVMQ